MHILVINSGSSSIKFAVIETEPSSFEQFGKPTPLIRGHISGIGKQARMEWTMEGQSFTREEPAATTVLEIFAWFFDLLQDWLVHFPSPTGPITIKAVGHRVVHGGPSFTKSVPLDQSIIKEIEHSLPLAPLHTASCLNGIHQTRAHLGDDIPMVAVFDTTFHHTLPPHAREYPLPPTITGPHHIHRYGFHGIAHGSLAQGFAQASGTSLKNTRLITCQLGNGSSLTAIHHGKSVETSMGFTPLEGLMMGTRSGDIDPSIITYLMKTHHMTIQEIDHLLSYDSGLLGISGRSSHMDVLLKAEAQEHDPGATLAIEMYCHRVRKYLGAYLAVLQGANAVVFGGGIGERSPTIRSRVCSHFAWCGLELDDTKNQESLQIDPGKGIRISSDHSAIAVYVVGTDEETLIAQETAQCLQESF